MKPRTSWLFLFAVRGCDGGYLQRVQARHVPCLLDLYLGPRLVSSGSGNAKPNVSVGIRSADFLSECVGCV